MASVKDTYVFDTNEDYEGQCNEDERAIKTIIVQVHRLTILYFEDGKTWRHVRLDTATNNRSNKKKRKRKRKSISLAQQASLKNR